MAAKKRIKSMKGRKESRKSIESLPKELLAQILALVASKSVTDLYNAKLSCKYLFQVSEDDFIFEHACLDKLISWLPNCSEKASWFLKRCEECGNPESLYRQGMYEYFSLSITNSGFNYLKRAAEKGHVESTYVYGIILVCSGGGEAREHGLKLLSSLKSLTTADFRMRIRRMIWRMWVHNILIKENFNVRNCNCFKNWNGTTWEGEDAVAPGCEHCFWDREVTFFCQLLRKNSVLK